MDDLAHTATRSQRATEQRSTPGPEAPVIARATLVQIWWALRPTHRDALSALAATGNYRKAAELCGLSHSGYMKRVYAARRCFLALWHEFETPSKVWRMDRRDHGDVYKEIARRRGHVPGRCGCWRCRPDKIRPNRRALTAERLPA